MIIWGYEAITQEKVVAIYDVEEALDALGGYLSYELSSYVDREDYDFEEIIENTKKKIRENVVNALLIKDGKIEEGGQQ